MQSTGKTAGWTANDVLKAEARGRYVQSTVAQSTAETGVEENVASDSKTIQGCFVD